ncbi:MAG TPA: tetratricopeptide repeat protein [Candidatus Eisenbacteria bacterium]|nr:tetratricopeptide repeat protein [Candidatus Eisenbacteria bacterium]
MSKIRPGTLRLRILVPILLLASSGCAYYNTFYLARRYYHDAEKEQEHSVSDETSVAAKTKYDQTVRQCTKVITEYPKSKWVDDATYLLAASLYGKGDYTAAIRRADDLELKFPKSPFVPEGRLVKGLSYYRRKDYDTADSIFQAMDAAYPKFPRRWELYYYEGESRFAQRDYTGALGWYRRAVPHADGRRQKADALHRAADALFEADRMDSAQLVYAETLKEEERSKDRLNVILRRAEALRNLKRYPEALQFLNTWRSTAIAENREGELLLRVYELQALTGRTNDAMKGYQDLVERFPGTNVAFESQFQIGYLVETAVGDLDRAGREYDKLRTVAGGNNQFAQQALRRSQSLATLKQFQQALKADTTGSRARTAFRLAEVLYFELGKTDSAMTQYRSVEALYPQSVYAPKSAYARLWISAFDRQDTLGASQLTDSIAGRYRGTRYAESALYLWKQWSGKSDVRTALFDSLLAHPDTSGAARYAEETEPADSLTGIVPPTSASSDSTYQVSPQIQRDLEERARKFLADREAAKKAREAGKKPPAAPPPVPPKTAMPSAPDTTHAAPADTTRAKMPPPTAPPDTTRSTAPPDTTRSAAPPDSGGTAR